MMNTEHAALVARIADLKRQKNAVILAHYYTLPEVQQAADFLGDSLALAQQAARTDARIILFAGVHFMAETAKVLCPDRKVLIPRPDAGCSLAESCDAAALARLKALHPDHVVVSYVNTSVAVKALTDICCTSSNALDVVRSIPADRPIIFCPDRNLGAYIRKITGRDNMILWDGACAIHEEFSLQGILDLKKAHPAARVVVHPECKAYIVAVADFVGSTAAILNYCATPGLDTFIVVTEAGILAEMRKRHPDKTFIPAPPENAAANIGCTACNECHHMKLVNLQNIISCLESESPEILIDEPTRTAAEHSIRNMIAIH